MKTKLAVPLLVITFIFVSLACQSSGPLGGLFATATPTPTNTSTPTPTVTPSPTFTPSPTPLPTGVQSESLADGSTKVIDYDFEYALLLSEDWLPIPANAEDLKKAVDTASEDNPELGETLKNLNEIIQDDTLRLLAYNTNKIYRDGTNFPNLIVVTLEDAVIKSLPLDFLVELNVEQIKESNLNAEVIDSGVKTNKNKVEYGYIVMENNVNQGSKNVNVRQYAIIFKRDSAMTLFTLTIPGKVKDQADTILQDLLDSLYWLEDLPK